MESTIREAVGIEPRMVLTLINEGTPPKITEGQRAYQNARQNLFLPSVRFSSELVANTLKARGEELSEAIDNHPLKSAADRNGYTLGSLRELNNLALQELNGDLNAKGVLKKTLEMVTDEEEARVREEAKYLTTEGIMINFKDGSIVHKTFPSQRKREMASIEAEHMKRNFLKGKDRLQTFTLKLK